MFIPDPDLDFLPIPDPGSRGQKGPDPGGLVERWWLNPGGGWLIMKEMVAKQRGRWLGGEMGCEIRVVGG